MMLAFIICMFYLSTQALPEVFGEGLCPSDWLYQDNSCYRAYESKKTWNEASKFCQKNQGELVSINSDEEQQFVYQNMAVNKSLWIGLVKDQKLGTFRWSNGQGLTYENWLVKPIISGPEDCGEMTDYGAYHGKWNDLTCADKLPFICEKGESYRGYFKKLSRKQLTNHVISHMTASSDFECLQLCGHHKNCPSVNYTPSTGICELNDASVESSPGDLVDSNEYDYFESL